jgi:hypothetical protein
MMPRPLNNPDPEIQKHYDGKKRREADWNKRYARLQKPILDDLRKCGVRVRDLYSLDVLLPVAATDVLLSHLQRLSADTLPGLKGTHASENLRLQDGVIRYLFLVPPAFDGRPLVDAFQNSWDEGLRWVILAVIAEQQPTGIDDWIEELMKTPRGKTLQDLKPKRRLRCRS